MVSLDAPLQGLGETAGAHRHHHELLEVNGVERVRATVDHVQHGHGQDVGIHSADVLRQLEVALCSRRLGNGERDGEQGVRAEAALVGGAVEIDHGLVHVALIGGFEALEGVVQFRGDEFDGSTHALPVPRGATIT